MMEGIRRSGDVRRERCTGCGACEAVCPAGCIRMEEDEEGLAYPEVREGKCVGCGMCVAVCAAGALGDNAGDLSGGAARAFAGWHRDEAVRAASSSGGVFYALAERVISRGGVVYGAAFDAAFQVEHRRAETVQELRALQGSKYAQSRIGGIYREAAEALAAGRDVLFAGTPCQVAGAAAFLERKGYFENGQEASGRLLLVDFVCHGVMSPMVWRRYLASRKRSAAMTAVSFRNKRRGWRYYSMEICYGDGKRYQRGKETDPMLRLIPRGLCLRLSCHVCPFKGDARRSDLTLADFWGVWREYPELYDERGVSLVFARTERGLAALRAVSDLEVASDMEPARSGAAAGAPQPAERGSTESQEAKHSDTAPRRAGNAALAVIEVDKERAEALNPSARQSAERDSRRAAFLKDVAEGDFDRVMDRYCPVGAAERMKAAIKDRFRRR